MSQPSIERVALAFESTPDKPSAADPTVVPDINTRFLASLKLVNRLTARVESLEARVAELESR
jgi:hypothetical protein